MKRSWMPQRKTPMRRPCRPMVKYRYQSLDTRKGLIAELDKVTSYIVRKRDGCCITCGTTENLTCSHFYSRRWLHVRFDLRNCATQCMNCNITHFYNVWPYLNWLLDTYTEIVLHELHILRMRTDKVTTERLREILDSHRQLLREMSKAA